jgi:hypothetical protein
MRAHGLTSQDWSCWLSSGGIRISLMARTKAGAVVHLHDPFREFAERETGF